MDIARIAPSVATTYDFSATGTLVDVGGGHGQLLASILQTHPTLHGVLFDLPHVVKGAPSLLAGVSERCEIVGGDVFIGFPLAMTLTCSRECSMVGTMSAPRHPHPLPSGHETTGTRAAGGARHPERERYRNRWCCSQICICWWQQAAKSAPRPSTAHCSAAAGFELTRIIPVVGTVQHDRSSAHVGWRVLKHISDLNIHLAHMPLISVMNSFL